MPMLLMQGGIRQGNLQGCLIEPRDVSVCLIDSLMMLCLGVVTSVPVSLQASPAPSIKALSPSQQHSQAGPTTPRTPHTPRTHAHTETATPSLKSPFSESQARPSAPTPHRLEHQSVPATPELASETGGHRADIGGNEIIPDRKRQQPGARAKSKLYGLPSAEDIDALCDMDNPGQSHLNLNAAYEPAEANLRLAPSLTGTTANPYQESADRPSSSNTVQNTHNIDMYTPQPGGSSQQGLLTQLGQYTSSSTFETPEAPMLHSQSFHPQSECDSSAYDEGASSTLIHSISNEEQIMQDMLEEDHDDGFYTNLDVQQHDREDEAHGNRVEQLNTMELHGILGQHGYKVPELAGEQEEAEDSDADGEDGDGDEDLDDNDEDYEEDGISDKNLFKVFSRLILTMYLCKNECCCCVCTWLPHTAQDSRYVHSSRHNMNSCKISEGSNFTGVLHDCACRVIN